MIKINLLGDEAIRDPRGILFVAGYAASVVATFVICFFLHSSITGKISSAENTIESLQQQLVKLQETTKEVRGLEKKRKDLQAKLAVIARLKLSKMGPVRVMDDLNLAIPEAAWLTSIREKGNELTIEGFALDPQTVSLFMTELAKSDYYKKVDLEETKQASRQGVRIQTFKIRATIDYAGAIPQPDADNGQRKAQLRGAVSSPIG